MLLTKTVIQKWNSKTKQHYESKGYIYTKMNDEFEVKIEDLTQGSHVLVQVKCDCESCKSAMLPLMPYKSYLRSVRENNKYYCKACGTRLFGTEATNKTRLSKSKSFSYWLVKNFSLKRATSIISRWDYYLNQCSPNEVCYSSMGFNKKGYWFKCPKGIHESELQSISSLTNNKQDNINCRKCNSFAQYLIDTYGENGLNMYWDYNRNTINPWDIAKGSNIRVYIHCQKEQLHGSYKMTCSSFYAGQRCSYCSHRSNKVHKSESLGYTNPKSLNYWSYKNNNTPFDYYPYSDSLVWWKCPNCKHDDYKRSIGESNRFEFRCPTCGQERTESRLQEKVRCFLESLDYTILHENNCTIKPRNPKTNHFLRYDNEIQELKIIVEVHGQQHYEISKFHYYGDLEPNEALAYQQWKDKYKKNFALSNDYYYLEIPYWTDDTKETWKVLINNKIHEALHSYGKVVSK